MAAARVLVAIADLDGTVLQRMVVYRTDRDQDRHPTDTNMKLADDLHDLISHKYEVADE